MPQASELLGDDGRLIVTRTRAFEDVALVNPTLGGFEALARVRQEYHALARPEEPDIHTIPVTRRQLLREQRLVLFGREIDVELRALQGTKITLDILDRKSVV